MIKNKSLVFYRMMYCLIFLFLILLILHPKGEQLNVFFFKTNDFFADFFNVLRYISERDPYHNEINGLGEKCYFPLAYLLLYPFSCLDNYASMSLADCWHSDMAIISRVLFAVLSCLVFIHSLSVLIKDKIGWQIYLVLLFSYIFLFSIERGNFIILTASTINYYLAFYKSKDVHLRYWALIALCIATALKVYPVMLGLLLLKEKRYCDILVCIIITAGLVFLPFLFFERGFDNVTQLWDNIQMNSDFYSLYRIYPRYSLPSLLYVVLTFTSVPETTISLLLIVSRVLIALWVLFSLYLAIKENNLWKSLSLLIMILIFLPTNSALYCGLYFFPIIILFLQKKEKSRYDWIYIVLFCIFLSPVQIMVEDFSISYILSNLALLIFWGIISITSYIDISKKRSLL